MVDIDALPNLHYHVNMHLLMHARSYGTLVNTSVAMKEMVHWTFKRMVQHTNLKHIDLDLLQ